jgi:general secretion pathway protein K
MIPLSNDRGAALLMALTTVALLTALTVDLAYQRRISLQIAVNARDELRATSLARSAVNLSRLVLHFQRELDRAAGGVGQALSQASGGKMPVLQLSIRLWEIVPIDSSAASLFAAAAAPAEAPPRPSPEAPASGPESPFAGAAPRVFGDYQGSFRARIEDEDRKVHVPQFANTAPVAGPQLLRFMQLVKDPAYDVLFDREDQNGNRWTRPDVAAALRDWVDENETTTTVGANPAAPFEEGFGDENFPYDRGENRYRAKNARFDSLDELFLVGGIGDPFMAAFGDKMTVYPSVNAKTNVNTSDPAEMMMNILAMSDPPGVPQPTLLDPTFPQRLDAALRLARPLPFLAVTVSQFAQILAGLGLRIQPLYLQAQDTDARNSFGSRSSTFTIRATGRSGSVEKALTAVVTFDERAGPLAADLGRLIHWRED